MDISIPKEFRLNKKDCKFGSYLNEKAKTRKYPKIESIIGLDNYKLLCLINGYINYIPLFSFNFSLLSQNQFLYIMKNYIMAEEKNVMMIPYQKYNKQNIYIIYQQKLNSNELNKMCLYLYLQKQIETGKIKPVYYINGKLLNYSKKDIHALYIFNYILNIVPKKLFKYEKKKYNSDLDEYLDKYKQVKKYDNFDNFKNYMQQISIKYDKKIEKYYKLVSFKKYKKNILKKSKPFKIDMKLAQQNPYYNSIIKKELNNFRKTIKI